MTQHSPADAQLLALEDLALHVAEDLAEAGQTALVMASHLDAASDNRPPAVHANQLAHDLDRLRVAKHLDARPLRVLRPSAAKHRGTNALNTSW